MGLLKFQHHPRTALHLQFLHIFALPASPHALLPSNFQQGSSAHVVAPPTLLTKYFDSSDVGHSATGTHFAFSEPTSDALRVELVPAVQLCSCVILQAYRTGSIFEKRKRSVRGGLGGPDDCLHLIVLTVDILFLFPLNFLIFIVVDHLIAKSSHLAAHNHAARDNSNDDYGRERRGQDNHKTSIVILLLLALQKNVVGRLVRIGGGLRGTALLQAEFPGVDLMSDVVAVQEIEIVVGPAVVEHAVGCSDRHALLLFGEREQSEKEEPEEQQGLHKQWEGVYKQLFGKFDIAMTAVFADYTVRPKTLLIYLKFSSL